YVGQALFFGTSALIGVSTLWLAMVFHRIPAAVLQLRVMREHDRLQRALLALGAGSVAGLCGLAPRFLYIELPLPWLVAWTVGWGVMVSVGFLQLTRLFRIPSPGAAFG
ncbi:MAG: hypothetical protein AABY30_03030, partial [Candidatus Thermoplasmatota archaeon]